MRKRDLVAFFLNIHNAMVVDGLIPDANKKVQIGGFSDYVRLLSSIKYNIAGLYLTPTDIEYLVLLPDKPLPKGIKKNTKRVKLNLFGDYKNDLLQFGISYGCAETPPIYIYTKDVNSELKRVAKSYITSRCICKDDCIVVPKVFKTYTQIVNVREFNTDHKAYSYLSTELASIVFDEWNSGKDIIEPYNNLVISYI